MAAFWAIATEDVFPRGNESIILETGKEYLVVRVMCDRWYYAVNREGECGWVDGEENMRRASPSENLQIQKRYDDETKDAKLEWLNAVIDQQKNDELAIYGYLREAKGEDTTDSVDVYQLIMQYFHIPINKCCFEWTIDSGEVLDKMKNAQVKTRMVSPETFQIGPWKWRMIIQPNGFSLSRRGSFDVGIELERMNRDWIDVSLVTLKSTTCPQTGCGVIALHNATTDSGGYWPTNTMRWDQIQDLQSLTLRVDLVIIQIRSQFYKEKIWYQMKTKYRKHQRLEWQLDEERMNDLRDCPFGKCVMREYEMYHDTWTLGLCPNGYRKEYEGQSVLCLSLCGMQTDFDCETEFEIEYELCIPELFFVETGTAVYNIRKGRHLWTVGTFEDFQKCQQLSVTISVWIKDVVKKETPVPEIAIEVSNTAANLEEPLLPNSNTGNNARKSYCDYCTIL